MLMIKTIFVRLFFQTIFVIHNCIMNKHTRPQMRDSAGFIWELVQMQISDKTNWKHWQSRVCRGSTLDDEK